MFAAIRTFIITFFKSFTHIMMGISNTAEGFENVTKALPVQGQLISDEALFEAEQKRREWNKALEVA